MSWRRSLLLPILTGLAVLLTGALGQQAPQSPPPSQPPSTPAPAAAPKEPKALPAAVDALAKAIDALDPKKIKWLQTNLWQRMDLQGLVFQTEGRYLSGPEHQMRLDMTVHLTDGDVQLRIVSDGREYWETMRLPNGEQRTYKVGLKSVLDVLNGPGSVPQLREEFDQIQSFAGMLPLLQSLRDQLTFVNRAPGRWKDHDIIKLTGVWAKPPTPPDKPWLAFFPRQCQLFLDAKTHWPYRLEWWGPSYGEGDDVLLLQIEFRDPVINQELPAKEFAYSTTEKDVPDRTKELTDSVRARAQHLAATKATPPRKPQ